MKWILSIICFTACLAAVNCRTCRTEDDCGEGQCCVGLTARQMMKKGLCLSLARLGTMCSETEAKVDYWGGKYLRYCPCKEGLVCEPKGLRPGVTDPDKIKASLRCQKPTATNPPEVVTDETSPPEIVTDGEVVETEAPEEIVETEAPEEVIETEAPEEEVIETEAPEEEIVETEAPEEEIVETEAPEEEIVETEAPEEEIVDEVGDELPEPEEGPGGERPRDDDCEDWELPCHEPERGPGGEPPRDDDCEDWELPC